MHKNSFDGFLKFKDSKTFYNKSGRTQHMKRLKLSDIKFKKLISLKKNQQKRVCVICGSSSYNLLFEKNNFKHVRCKKCEFVYVNPILKQQVQENALKVESSYTQVLKNKINIKLDNLRFKYGLQKINIIKKKKKLLDYGCGFGQSLDVAKKFNWDCSAYEINEQCIEILKKKKIKIDNNFKKDSYDAITMWLVLEHIPDPNKLIKKIYNSLKNKGKLLINVPNVNSLTALLQKDKCTMFAGEQHLNHFSVKTLSMFLKKNKFKLKFIETVISDAGTARNFLDYKDPKMGQSKLRYQFTDVKYMHKHQLGYTLLAIAEKDE